MKKSRLNPEQISDFFLCYKETANQIHTLTEKIYEKSDKDTWITNFKLRSQAMRDAFNRNLEFNRILLPLFEGREELTYDQAEIFYTELVPKFDVGLYDDPFYAVRVIEMLIMFYSERGDLLRLIPLYNRQGYELTSTIRMGCTTNFDRCYDCYRAVLTYQDKYFLIPDSTIRRNFFVAYYNIICVLPSLTMSKITLDLSAQYMLDMLEFFNRPEVQRIDGNNPLIKGLVEYTKEKWLSFEDQIDDAATSTKNLFIKLAQEVYETSLIENNGDIYKCSVESLLAYHHSQVLLGRCSHRDATNYLLDYYYARKKLPISTRGEEMNNGTNDNFYFETKLPDALVLRWLDDPSIPSAISHHERMRLIESKNAFLDSISSDAPFSPYINSTRCHWCFSCLKYLDTLEDKERTIFNMVVNRQLPTFFHSYMVAELAVMFCNEILDTKPGLFLGIKDYNNTEELLNQRDKLVSFVKKSALFHDVGKNLITDIINTQHRKLTDDEFAIIRQHPDMGAEAIDTDFNIYHDVIVGHHMTYDLKGGYPLGDGIADSPMRIVCDIVSICDSLDAATDYLGRYYAEKKDFPTVLEELRDGSGTRYNPSLVEMITFDRDFYTRINYLLTNNREEKYYEFFTNYFNK